MVEALKVPETVDYICEATAELEEG